MPRTVKKRQGPSQNFDITYPDALEEIRLDGFADVMAFTGGIKLVGYQTRFGDIDSQLSLPPEERVEQRQACIVVSVPALQFLQTVTSIVAGYRANLPALKEAADADIAQLESAIRSLEALFAAKSHGA